jgi:hypothetical protein
MLRFGVLSGIEMPAKLIGIIASEPAGAAVGRGLPSLGRHLNDYMARHPYVVGIFDGHSVLLMNGMGIVLI